MTDAEGGANASRDRADEAIEGSSSSGRRGILSQLANGLARVVNALATASSLKRAATAFLAGALSVLAMAPFFLWPVLFVTLPLLVWLIDTADRRPSAPDDGRDASPYVDRDRDTLGRAGIVGWFFGLGYFIFGLFWVGEAFLVEAEIFAWLLPAAVTMLPAGLALFFSAAAIVARALWRPGLARILMLALLLGLAEWLRGHILTGLPWNILGYALTAPPVLMQSAGLIGVYSLTLVAVVTFASPLVLLADAANTSSGTPRFAWRAMSGFVMAAVMLATLVGYGISRLQTDASAFVDGVRLRLVQPSVPQRDKWRREKQREIFDLHLELSRTNAAGERDDMSGITHVVWPEASMPFLPLESPKALQDIGEMLPDNVVLLAGALRIARPAGDAGDGEIPRRSDSGAPRPRLQVYNSLMAFGGEGGLIALYDKIHLVPFGEYLPLQNFLESIGLEQLTRIRGGFLSGRSPRPLIDVPGLPPFVSLVCYEAIFPAAVVQGVERPELIVNVTNDGWFGNTTGPRQHFHMARVRAVEEGVPLVRSANNGISALIDPYGRVIGQIELDRRGVLDVGLPRAALPPIYAFQADRIYWLASLLLLAVWGGISRRST